MRDSHSKMAANEGCRNSRTLKTLYLLPINNQKLRCVANYNKYYDTEAFHFNTGI